MADMKAEIAKTDAKKADPLAGADGFAEVFPEDKYVVVKRLQAAGHVTGMTGDGVNDAPALRQAEVGIAVSSATDVAKGAASVVLTEPGLTNIVALVEQGRTIYQRILTWIINKISRTILKAAFVAVAYIVTGKFVVSAFAMLLLIFMTDFAKIALATDHVRPSRKPETWNIGGFVTGVRGPGHRHGRGSLGLPLVLLVAFGLATNRTRFPPSASCAALFRRVLRGVGPGAPLVLVHDAQPHLDGSSDRGCAHRNGLDLRGPPGLVHLPCRRFSRSSPTPWSPAWW